MRLDLAEQALVDAAAGVLPPSLRASFRSEVEKERGRPGELGSKVRALMIRYLAEAAGDDNAAALR